MKVKRLFFWLDKRHDNPWCDKPISAHQDLGSGRRVMVEGGKLDAELSIAVPSHMASKSLVYLPMKDRADTEGITMTI